CSVGIRARGSRAVDCYHPEDGKREHRDQQPPILAQQLSKKRRHAVLSRLNSSVPARTSEGLYASCGSGIVHGLFASFLAPRSADPVSTPPERNRLPARLV